MLWVSFYIRLPIKMNKSDDSSNLMGKIQTFELGSIYKFLM